VGLLFDILGAGLVYVGVCITIRRAAAIETIHQIQTIDDMGDPDLLRKNSAVAEDRARERVRASAWAGAGLISFLVGFTLQAIGAWPK
jgi:hypothetical protein